jgi:hypothetical protein
MASPLRLLRSVPTRKWTRTRRAAPFSLDFIGQLSQEGVTQTMSVSHLEGLRLQAARPLQLGGRTTQHAPLSKWDQSVSPKWHEMAGTNCCKMQLGGESTRYAEANTALGDSHAHPGRIVLRGTYQIRRSLLFLLLSEIIIMQFRVSLRTRRS